MLDQPDYIARYDKHDALAAIEGLPAQLGHAFTLPKEVKAYAGVTNVVVAGMGGSALGGEFIKTWLGDQLPVPFIIVRDYSLPAFVGPDTLVIAASYSGNTEETLAAIREAGVRNARIAVMATGGKLLQIAQDNDYPALILPGGLQPRFAVFYAVRAMVTLLEGAGLLMGATGQLEAAGQWLETQLDDWKPEAKQDINPAKRIAEALVGHPVMMYAGPSLAFSAMDWKIAFNENAKHLAFYNYLPEMNHNEFLGWQHPERSGIKVIELRSDLDNAQIGKRFDVTNRLLSSAFAPIQIHADGASRLEQLVWTIALGEYVATYLAFLNGIDPTPVDLIEKLKAEL